MRTSLQELTPSRSWLLQDSSTGAPQSTCCEVFDDGLDCIGSLLGVETTYASGLYPKLDPNPLCALEGVGIVVVDTGVSASKQGLLGDSDFVVGETGLVREASSSTRCRLLAMPAFLRCAGL